MRLQRMVEMRYTPCNLEIATIRSFNAIRARAPLRLGLAGGGTDLSPYCDEHGGAVLNGTIDRYAFAVIEPSADGMIHFVAKDIEVEECLPASLDGLAGAQLALHAGVYRRMMREHGGSETPPLRVTTFVDAPPGSGLGSSSALVVALVEAFRHLLDVPLGAYEVAHLAFEIERLDLGLPGGKQDQYAAAFGGVNFVEFYAADRVIVNPLRVPRAFLAEVESSLVTCFTGVSRRSEQIIRDQQHGMARSGDALESLHQLKREAVEMKQALLRGEVAHMAAVLNRSWEAKKRTAPGISTGLIERLEAAAMAHGAIGCKVSGAGGGGFMMFLVPPERRVELVRALTKAGGEATPVRFTTEGAEAWDVPGGAR